MGPEAEGQLSALGTAGGQGYRTKLKRWQESRLCSLTARQAGAHLVVTE